MMAENAEVQFKNKKGKEKHLRTNKAAESKPSPTL
jgi:hypothetical protein